ncbi:S-adenosylmethionine:tRNA ribosyltransferase-isomerase [Candidatus Saccharibacteria bacterium]|nr:S-adenosylmethionine:tRNA ribosyltransferase-isomerase [Candidatus Saccharibacteria bacterium]
MRTENIEDHQIHSEWFHIPDDTLEVLRSVTSSRTDDSRGDINGDSLAGDAAWGTPARATARVGEAAAAGPAKGSAANSRPRIVAVGTTVARTLEYYARTGKTSGEDDIFIYPGFEFKIVDALLTNYHAPKSTVLMLASAFAGWDYLKNAYEHAIEQEYNFLSYGDSMLIC